MDNQTTVTEFILLGFSSNPQIQIILLVVFLVIYLITLVGNVTIILAIGTNSNLHTPMYFLLCHLAFLDIAFSSVTVPKTLQNLIVERKTISLRSCFTQVFFALFLLVSEGLLLSVMAYDRYVAICHPLHYTVRMSRHLCCQLAYGALLTSFSYALIHLFLLHTLHFCGPNVIHHFSCELPQLFKLSCNNSFPNQMLVFTVGSLLGSGALLITLASYVHIISAIVRIRSKEGKRKAFSTCSSHLTIVVLYYGTIFFRYLKPTTKDSQELEMGPSVVYFILTPMLNPIIYSLRNQDVKKAFLNMLVRKHKSEGM